MSDERKPPDHHKPFEDMARRVVDNMSHGFGGAFVIVPPADGTPIDALILDSRQDPVMFWANIKTIAEITIAELDEKQRQQFGGRR
jgi:hypothetical protein